MISLVPDAGCWRQTVDERLATLRKVQPGVNLVVAKEREKDPISYTYCSLRCRVHAFCVGLRAVHTCRS